MRTRVPRVLASGPLTVLPLVVAFVVLVGCVPEPTNRVTASGAGAVRTSVPTPAGPTPTPSYVAPTPTPMPTFFVHIVRRGDTLDRIARLYGTDTRSIAYWNRLAYPSLDPDSGQYRPNYIAVGWALQLIPNTVVDPEDLPPGGPTPSPDFTDGPEETDGVLPEETEPEESEAVDESLGEPGAVEEPFGEPLGD